MKGYSVVIMELKINKVVHICTGMRVIYVFSSPSWLLSHLPTPTYNPTSLSTLRPAMT